MTILYNLFFIVFGIFYLPYLVFKRRAHKDFAQRIGLLPKDVSGISDPVWIHAVSVGEAALAVELSRRIKGDDPNIPVILSTTTETGNNLAMTKGKNIVDAVFYFPLDISFIVSNVLEKISPRIFLMIETEVWPNLLTALEKRGIPVVLVNGRISDNSFRNYRKIGFIMRAIFSKISLCCMQTEVDKKRIVELGVSEDRVKVAGNMKFDSDDITNTEFNLTKEALGFDGKSKVLVAGSTHHPEEKIIIDTYLRLKEKHKELKLVIAPRHIERATAIGIYLESKGLTYCRYSDMLKAVEVPAGMEVLMVDTIGHLKNIYAVSTIIFAGGSLVPKGGQNPIEGASLGKAVVFGAHMFNFREVSQIFLENNAAVKVKDNDELFVVLDDLLGNDVKRETLGSNAARVVRSNMGAIEKTMLEISGLL